MKSNKAPKAVEILADSSRGIYIPKHFAEACPNWSGIDQEQYRILNRGPNNVHYWDTWEQVLNNAYYIEESTGRKFQLHHDGDLFALCLAEMSPEEKENFGFND